MVLNTLASIRIYACMYVNVNIYICIYIYILNLDRKENLGATPLNNDDYQVILLESFFTEAWTGSF